MIEVSTNDERQKTIMTNFTVNYITHQDTISVEDVLRIFPNARINWSTF